MKSTDGTGPYIIQTNPDVTGTGVRVCPLKANLADKTQIRASIYVLALGGRIFQFLISQIVESKDYKEFKDAVDSTLGI